MRRWSAQRRAHGSQVNHEDKFELILRKLNYLISKNGGPHHTDTGGTLSP